MNYSDIIKDNCKNHSSVSWWPRFAYHYTDVSNAVNILSSGFLYSRAKAEELGVMKNDNASKQVIDMTKTQARSSVRFYFRPLTPTQYYNEGFKHPRLRYDDDENANTPVPVFFLFDLEKLLSLPGVEFSEKKQSGYGSELKSGIEAFSKLDFDKIYENSFDGFASSKDYRHAEILYPKFMEIDTCLVKILCRNSIEKTTLLNMVKNQSLYAYNKYKDKVSVCKTDMFENNGLFVKNCSYHDNTVSVLFSNTYYKKKYIERMAKRNGVDELQTVTVQLVLTWLNSRGEVGRVTTETEIDYETPKVLNFTNIPKYSNANKIRIQVFIEKCLMCSVEQSLESSEIIQ